MSETDLVVVTGAEGFIGRALVARFVAAGRAYRAIVRELDPSRPAKTQFYAVGDLATVIEADLDAILAGASAVVHLAGRAHVLGERGGDAASAYATANVTATARLARAAGRAGVRRFVFASTVKVNGETSMPSRPFRPDDAPAPQDEYAKSKLQGEQVLSDVCAGTQMAPIVLRLPLVYGPGVKANFAKLLDEIGSERRLPLGAIRNRRSLLYLGNLVGAIEAALDAVPPPSGVHFVADAESPSVPELLAATGRALGVPVHLMAVPVRLLVFGGRLIGQSEKVARLVGTLEVDTSSFTAATGWRPRNTLAEGLAATALWWRMRHSI
ncbi:MAG: NAD-dependent epimerase/dehydratase family protein [Betaproteobacteria bacterium]